MGATANKTSQTAIEGAGQTNTTNTGSKTTDDRGATANERGANTEGSTEKEFPKLVMVDVPNVEKPKRGPGRPKGSTNKKKETKKTASVDTKHLKILIKTISDIIASKPGMQMWALSMEEIEAIEKPLSKVLERHAKVSEIAGEYGDYASLIIVCATIFIPKYLIWKAAKEQTQEVKQDHARPKLQTIANKTRTSSTSDRSNTSETSRTNTANVTNFGGELSQYVSPIM